jgi:GT2 family glycosyltransferase
VPAPLVSVVVSTRDRPQLLRQMLQGLQAQTLPSTSFEVVVVDDGSRPPIGELALHPLDVRIIRRSQPQGQAAGRNAGWRAARAPLIAFTDDDCVAQPDWLEQLLAVAGADDRAVVQGATLPDPAPSKRPGLLSRTVRVDRLGPQFEACNILYGRAALEALGGFDERFGPGATGEDTDMAWRAIESGFEPVFASGAVVYHAVRDLRARDALLVAWRWGSAVRALARHPGARAILYRGVFWNVWHYLMWRSLLARLGPRWLSRLLVRLHLLQLRRRAIEAGAGTWAVPYLLAHDLVECAAIARAALRYRTLVL